MLAAVTSESIPGGGRRREPPAGGCEGERGGSGPALGPREARVTLRGPWQGPCSGWPLRQPYFTQRRGSLCLLLSLDPGP